MLKGIMKKDPIGKKLLKRKPKEIHLRGTVTAGVMRGSALIDLFYDRIRSVLKIKPYKGTFDIRLEKPVRMETIYSEMLYHYLPHIGKIKVDLFIAPVKLIAKGEEYQCWAIRQGKSIYRDDMLEIIAADKIREKFGLNDGDEVEVVLTRNFKRLKFDVRAFVRGEREVIVRK